MGRRKKKPAASAVDDDDASQTFFNVLEQKLRSLQLCSSEEEYASVAEAIASSGSLSQDELPSKEDLEEIVSTLVNYFEGDVQVHDAKAMIHAVVMDVWGDDFADNLGWIDNGTTAADNDEQDDNQDEDESDDDGDFVGEGECELCERTVKLTRHHLIPKTTWPRIKKRLWNAASTIETYHSLDDESSQEKKEITKNKLEKMLGMTDISDIPTIITHDSVRGYLSKVCLLCRWCHSAVHRIHTEMELATQYNTLDRLFGDEEILKFGKWASKQRPGKYAI
jgi:hypothetical protein